MVFCNTSLVTIGDEAVKHEVPLFSSVTFHHIGLAITAVFAVIATIIALSLMFLHATHYSCPYQQKHIIRILFMIPIYACISFVSYVYYKHALYWEVLRDCYEAFAIASFFTLMCHYLEKDLHEQKERFRQLRPRNWVWPVPWVQKCTGGANKGPLRIPRSGLTWFNVIYVGVYQYCFIRVVFTFVAMFSQLFKRYCESSLNPAFAHIWVMVFEASSVTVAMYCLIQFYIQLKGDLSEHRPFMKILCIKLVIFFSFWQSLLISFISSSSAPGGALLKPSSKIAYPDIKVGIPSMLLAVEMSIFAILHIFAFPWKTYDITKSPDPAAYYQGGFLGWKAFLDAFNLWDIVKAAARGFRWLFHGARHRHADPSYEPAAGGGGKVVDTRYAGAGAAGFAARGAHPLPKYMPHAGYAGEHDQELNTMHPPTYDERGRTGAVAAGVGYPPMRTQSEESSEDHRGLLSHQQPPAGSAADPIPRIQLREPSREPSPYGGDSLSRETTTTTSQGYYSQQGSGPFRDPSEPPGARSGNPFEDASSARRLEERGRGTGYPPDVRGGAGRI